MSIQRSESMQDSQNETWQHLALTTVLYEPDGGFYLLDRHLARLRIAHQYLCENQLGPSIDLGTQFEDCLRATLWQAVREIGEGFPQRIRIVIDSQGNPMVSSELLPDGPLTPVTLCLDTRPTRCPHIGHKTTARSFYNQARQRVGARLKPEDSDAPFDVLMWNPCGFLTETSIANVAVEMFTQDGRRPVFVTPRTSAGIIPGVMRQELIDTGIVVEGDIRVEDALQAAQRGMRIIVFNALRKVLAARLVCAPGPISASADGPGVGPVAVTPSTPLSMGVGVIIDCYDSYTNNILSCLNVADLPPPIFEQYLQDNVAVIRLQTFDWPLFRSQILPHLDWIIISPGPGHPGRTKDFGFCAELLRYACIPILGVCLGHQGLVHANGGDIVSSEDVIHGRAVTVYNTGVGIFADVPSAAMVRYNSLCVDPYHVPPDIRVTAWSRSTDGTSIEIMGVEHLQKPHFGVQFHLESICSDAAATREIMQNFARIVAQSTGGRRSALPEICRSASYIDFGRFKRTACLPVEPSEFMQLKCRELNVALSPSAVVTHLLHQAKDLANVNLFWLDSARTSPRDPLSRFSFLGTTDRSIRYEDGKIHLCVGSEDTALPVDDKQTFWDWLNCLQCAMHCSVRRSVDCPWGFRCGLVGYLGYELGKETLDGYAKAEPPTGHQCPLSEFMLVDQVLVLDHLSKAWYALAVIRTGARSPTTKLSQVLPCDFGITEGQFSDWIRGVETLSLDPIPESEDILPPHFEFSSSRQAYCDTVRRILQCIGEGESYEMNLTGQFSATLDLSPSLQDICALYLETRARNPASYSSLMSFCKSRTHILSTSPELFLQLAGEAGVNALMKPIKGTLRRTLCVCDPCTDPAACEAVRARLDEQRVAAFRADPKECAENLMIVDLIRADLQNFCHTASVRVPKLMDVEASETVYSMVTSVEGQLAAGVGPVEAIRRSFPPGSMTGAPKLRSVELLEGLENKQARGIYSGCLGYISVDNRASFNVVIRTLVIRDRFASVGAGGAITWLSDPESEWDEVVLKARSVLRNRI